MRVWTNSLTKAEKYTYFFQLFIENVSGVVSGPKIGCVLIVIVILKTTLFLGLRRKSIMGKLTHEAQRTECKLLFPVTLVLGCQFQV